MALVQSLNVGSARPIAAKAGTTGIDKVPIGGPVEVRAPSPGEKGTSGLAGDVIGDRANHGGADQALYAYAREDLDWWEAELGVPLRSGTFGENLTTLGLDVTGAVIGETWRIGADVVCQVSSPRIPCAVFARWMDRKGWLRSFTRRAVPGAYLRVLAPGVLRAGDGLSVESRPDHGVTIGTTFRALTLEPELLGGLLGAADFLGDETLRRVAERRPFALDDGEP